MKLTMPFTPKRVHPVAPAPAKHLATVYTRGGQTLRVPLRPAPVGTAGCVGHPELQLMRWLRNRASAEPGFPVRVRSVLLVVERGGCPTCQAALRRFLSRFRLDTKLRLVRTGAHPLGCSCGCSHCQASRPAPKPLLDELLGESLLRNEDPEPPQGIPGGRLGNSWHATLGQARQAAAAEAARLNAASSKTEGKYRYRIAHHKAKQPHDTPHYHVVDEGGNQISGHFFYGKPPIRIQQKNRYKAPLRDRNTPNAIEEWSRRNATTPDYADILNDNKHRTEWHVARLNKAQGRQRRRARKGYELEQESNPLIDARLDVHAQYALQRLLSSPDPSARADGAGLLSKVKGGQLKGIYKEDQYEPARWAKSRGRGWWDLLGPKPNVDAAVLLWANAATPAALLPPLVIFRDRIRSNAALMDSALQWAHQVLLAIDELKATRPGITAPQVWSALAGVPVPSNAVGLPWAILRNTRTAT